ncbi:hypothetical protein OAS39_07900 [Pirellulales bacterium]|nr:hypothetical protein [Pirellulales bacterium]
MLNHRRQQHAVGQGFFHSGSVAVPPVTLQYVYDCGSGNDNALTTAIHDYIERLESSNINLLFVSHLDWDHVNGLDRLLAAAQADTVVLPYLSGIDILALLADANAVGRADGSYLDLISNPIGWFGDRGVTRVILVRGNDSDFQEGPPPSFPNEPEVPQGGEGITIDLDALNHDDMFTVVSPNSARDVQVFVISHNIPILLRVNGKTLNWSFVTFVHPEHRKIEDFRRALDNAFPGLKVPDNAFDAGTDWHRRLGDILRDPDERNKLGSCYLAIRKNRNLTSMSLYSGPFRMHPSFSAECTTLSTDLQVIDKRTERCAWLGTGDADLSAVTRRRAFLSHFKRLRQFVRTMSLPHHGAERNFDNELAENGPPLYVASAGAHNSYGHPGKEVLLTLKGMERQCLITTEELSSAIVETVVLGPSPTQVSVFIIGRTTTGRLFSNPVGLWSNHRVDDLIDCYWQVSEMLGQDLNRLVIPQRPSSLRAYDWTTLERIDTTRPITSLRKPPVVLVLDDELEFALDELKAMIVEHADIDEKLEAWRADFVTA